MHYNQKCLAESLQRFGFADERQFTQPTRHERTYVLRMPVTFQRLSLVHETIRGITTQREFNRRLIAIVRPPVRRHSRHYSCVEYRTVSRPRRRKIASRRQPASRYQPRSMSPCTHDTPRDGLPSIPPSINDLIAAKIGGNTRDLRYH